MKATLLVTVLLLLSACAGGDIAKETFSNARAIPRDAHTPPLFFTRLDLRLPKGQEIGQAHHDDYGCFLFPKPVGAQELRGDIEADELRATFENTLEPLGYDVVSAPDDFLFEEEARDEALRMEYKIAAKMINAKVSLCVRDSRQMLLGFERGGIRGKMRATYEWSIFDTLRRTTVYKVRTEGYTHRKTADPRGAELMILDTFEMAAHNLAADPSFYNLIVRGTPPPKIWRQNNKDPEERPRQFNAQETVTLTKQKRSRTPLPQHMDRARQIAILIDGGTGHGSGFFVTDQGHVLTNAHVVGNSRRVIIVTSGKQEKILAEVLRVDKAQDVALLRLEAIPDSLNIKTLPVRADWPEVGEDVYTIGTPRYKKLQDTVSKGIISAHRPATKLYGTRVNLLQADVSVHPGSSGGPLLDAHGNIIGLSVSDHGTGNEALNFFIPIGSALKALKIEY